MADDKNWVELVRQTLSNIGVQVPEELIPDGQIARAIAIDLRINLYASGNIEMVTPQTTIAWLVTNKIEINPDLESDVTRIANEVYFENRFRETVFKSLYEQDLKRKRLNPEH